MDWHTRNKWWNGTGKRLFGNVRQWIELRWECGGWIRRDHKLYHPLTLPPIIYLILFIVNDDRLYVILFSRKTLIGIPSFASAEETVYLLFVFWQNICNFVFQIFFIRYTISASHRHTKYSFTHAGIVSHHYAEEFMTIWTINSFNHILLMIITLNCK